MNTYLALSFDSPEVIIWSICIGFNIAIVITYVLKRIIGGLITSILDKGATAEEKSLTLAQLGYNKSKIVKLYLKDNSNLRKTVTLAFSEKLPLTKNHKGKDITDFENARFYIPESFISKAESFKKGVLKWYFIPLFFVLSVIISSFIIFILPYITF